jgi:26S proteasome regulatory subunit T5
MSSAPPPGEPPTNPEKRPEEQQSDVPGAFQDGAAMDTTPDQPPEETWADIPEEVMTLSTDEILTRIRLIENDIKVSAVDHRAVTSPAL